ncbi:MAG: hypothetical protein QOD64_621 [Verrucomicrobiota bacterium]
MSVNVHIERLILEGMSGQMDRAKLGAAVEAELAQLLRRGTLDGATSHHQSRVAAAPLALVRPNDFRLVGTQIGGAVHQALASTATTTAHFPCHS